MKTKPKDLMSLLIAHGRKFYGDESLLTSASETDGKLEFFTLGRYVSDDDLEKEYASRNLTPAGLCHLAEYANDHLEEMDKMGWVATYWQDKGWCYATFDRWCGGRCVHVGRGGSGWVDGWWFAGVRKISSENSISQPSPSNPLPLELRVAQLERELEKLRTIINF